MKNSDSLQPEFISRQTPMQASKWMQTQILLDDNEMEKLFSDLGDFYIFMTGGLTKPGKGKLAKQEFLEKYRHYVTELKYGFLPDDNHYRGYFSSVFTLTPEHLFAIPAGEGKQILRIAKPVIQLQYHRMGYSPIDGKFRPKIFGIDSIHWGIQFSYPQLYSDPVTKNVQKVDVGDNFPNTVLYRKMQKWFRQHSIPTPFCVNEKTVNVPIRLGKQCFPWVNNHRQLSEKGITVKGYDKVEM